VFRDIGIAYIGWQSVETSFEQLENGSLDTSARSELLPPFCAITGL